MEKIKVKDHPDFVRDTKSRAIVNNNTQDYEKYIESYKKRQAEKNKMNEMESQIMSVRKELDEIKELLRSLISK